MGKHAKLDDDDEPATGPIQIDSSKLAADGQGGEPRSSEFHDRNREEVPVESKEGSSGLELTLAGLGVAADFLGVFGQSVLVRAMVAILIGLLLLSSKKDSTSGAGLVAIAVGIGFFASQAYGSCTVLRFISDYFTNGPTATTFRSISILAVFGVLVLFSLALLLHLLTSRSRRSWLYFLGSLIVLGLVLVNYFDVFHQWELTFNFIDFLFTGSGGGRTTAAWIVGGLLLLVGLMNFVTRERVKGAIYLLVGGLLVWTIFSPPVRDVVSIQYDNIAGNIPAQSVQCPAGLPAGAG